MSSRDAVIKTILEALQARGFSEAEAEKMVRVIKDCDAVLISTAESYNEFIKDQYEAMRQEYEKNKDHYYNFTFWDKAQQNAR